MRDRCSVKSLLSDLHIWCLIIQKGVLERGRYMVFVAVIVGKDIVGDGKIVMMTGMWS